jgi:hypothetical protein
MLNLLAIESGIGDVYNQKKFIGKVHYHLDIFQDQSGLKSILGEITIINDGDNFWPIQPGTLFTLHLQDHRKMDFYCSHSDVNSSTCKVEGKSDFYV